MQFRVGSLLVGGEIDLEGLFQLIGKIRGDLGFGPAQHPRADPAQESMPHLRRIACLEGVLVAFLEIAFRAQIAWQQKVEERPEVPQRVFQWGAGENEASPSLEGHGGGGILAVGVLDVLRLVEDRCREAEAFVVFDIAPEQRVARDHEIVRGDLRKPGLAGTSLKHQHSHAGAKAVCLALPVPYKRRRAHHEMRPRQGGRHGEGLECFSESHLVRKQPARFAQRQAAHPQSPLQLISAKQVPQAFRQDVRAFDLAFRWRLVCPIADRRLQARAVDFMNPIAAALLPRIAVAQHLLEILEHGRVGHGDAAVRQPHPGIPPGKQALNILSLEHCLAARCEMHMEVQPPVATLLDRESRFDRHNVARHMTEPLSFGHVPFPAQRWQSDGEKPDHRLLATQHRLAFRVFEAHARQFHQGRSLRRRIRAALF